MNMNNVWGFFRYVSGCITFIMDFYMLKPSEFLCGRSGFSKYPELDILQAPGNLINMLDSTPQAADIEIFNRLRQGDIVITKDYGLASLVLGKNGKAMSPSGFMYTKQNIEILLQQRYINGILRNSGGRKRKRRPKYRQEEAALA